MLLIWTYLVKPEKEEASGKEGEKVGRNYTGKLAGIDVQFRMLTFQSCLLLIFLCDL